MKIYVPKCTSLSFTCVAICDMFFDEFNLEAFANIPARCDAIFHVSKVAAS